MTFTITIRKMPNIMTTLNLPITIESQGEKSDCLVT